MPGTLVIKGVTTVRWGTGSANANTGNAVLQNALNTAIVKKIMYKRLGGAPTLIQDNNGFTAILVGLNDGDELQITCVDDTAITWPVQYDIITMKVPGAANAKNFILIEDGIDLERKREGDHTMTVNWFTNSIV